MLTWICNQAGMVGVEGSDLGSEWWMEREEMRCDWNWCVWRCGCLGSRDSRKWRSTSVAKRTWKWGRKGEQKRASTLHGLCAQERSNSGLLYFQANQAESCYVARLFQFLQHEFTMLFRRFARVVIHATVPTQIQRGPLAILIPTPAF